MVVSIRNKLLQMIYNILYDPEFWELWDLPGGYLLNAELVTLVVSIVYQE